MIREYDQDLNDFEIQEFMLHKLKGLNQKYEIKESWVLQFLNQNLYLSNVEIIDFINSCKEVSLSSGSRFVPNTTSGDFVYCLISGRSKIMRIDSEENNWELKRLKLVTLHNYKVSKRDEMFCIAAECNSQFLRFNLPFSREQHKVLSVKRSFLCSFFNLDFNRASFEVLDLFQSYKYICGQKISAFKDKLIIVKDGMCNYTYKQEGSLDSSNNKIALLDRSGPFILNIQNFTGSDPISNEYQITVKQAHVPCLEVSIAKVMEKNFYYSAVVKKVKEFCEREQQWISNVIEEKRTEIENSEKTMRRISIEPPENLTLSRFNNIEINKRLFDNQEQELNFLARTASKSRIMNGHKRGSLQIELGKTSMTPVPPDEDIVNMITTKFKPRVRSRKSFSAIRKNDNPESNAAKSPSDKMNSLRILSDYQQTINKKKKILKSKLKQNDGNDLNLFRETLNTQTKSFKLRMIHTGIKVVPADTIKHTSSLKRLTDIKTKYIEKIERSNRIGIQCMVIRSDSQEQFIPHQEFAETRRMSMSTKRLSNTQYHNYLVHGDLRNPKEQPLEKVHQKVRMLSTSYTATYNHTLHLKSKAKLLRYSSNRVRSPKKP